MGIHATFVCALWFVVDSLDKYAASDKKSDSIQSHKIIATVHVRYVKRELRSMSDSDREAFLDALEIVSSHFSMM